MPRRLITNRSDANFHAAEAARLALMKTCKMLETPEQPSTLAKIGFSRKPAKVAANAAMQGRVADGFVQLRDYINGLESVWKSRQGRVRLFANCLKVTVLTMFVSLLSDFEASVVDSTLTRVHLNCSHRRTTMLLRYAVVSN